MMFGAEQTRAIATLSYLVTRCQFKPGPSYLQPLLKEYRHHIWNSGAVPRFHPVIILVVLERGLLRVGGAINLEAHCYLV